MRVLVLNPELPFPPVMGGQSRTYHLLRGLSQEHEITLVVFTANSAEILPVCPFPVEVVSVPWVRPELYKRMHEGSPAEAEAAFRYLSYEAGEPWFVSCYDCPAMERTLRELSPESFDLILIEHSFMARFLPALPLNAPRVLDMHNVHTLMAWRRVQQACGSEKDEAIKEFERTRRFERMVSSQCQFCLCCSAQEAGAARDFLEVENAVVIPNGVDTAAMTPCGGPVTPGYLLFTGTMGYEPNVEAARYFTGSVLPLIRDQAPNATFHIAGINPAPEVHALASSTVFVHGFVPDMRPYFNQAEVVVVPLLHGGGTRLKILEAAACGKAIVSTPIGAEGLKFVDGRDLLLADSAPRFAKAVAGLLSDPSGRNQLSQSARRAAEEYDWSKIAYDFCSAINAAREQVSYG